jgi:ribokinase
MWARIRVRMRIAVVGHTEWVEFGRVEHVPAPGGIAHATDAWEEPAGGGAVAAVQLARLCGSCTFYTAFGDDERGEWSRRELERLGVRVEAAMRAEPTRRAVTLIDADGERTIATLGRRLEPSAADRLAWNELEQMDAAYVTAGNAGALREARRARVLVATARAMPLLVEADVHLDAVVGSGRDPAERFDPDPLTHPPHLVVHTDGIRGGRYETSDGRAGRYEAAAPPGPVVDTYGAGDSFAAGVTYALAAGLELEAALELAARCGAWCVSGRGPYGRRLPAGGPG